MQRQPLIQQLDAENHYQRLAKRTQLAQMFWREKLIEITSNHRVWKKLVAKTDADNPVERKIRIIQTRRIKRLVAQAYVEYRRKQSELKMLLELARQSKIRLDEIETSLFLRMADREADVWKSDPPSNAA